MDNERIYKTLSQSPHNSLYLNRYINFIESCTKVNKKRNPQVLEHHHILPKSMWPEYTSLYIHKWNKVSLTPRQHFICHMILSKCFGGEMTTAFYMMCKIRSGESYYKVTNRVYENLKYLCNGKNHRDHVSIIYTFKNIVSGEIRKCTRYDICKDEDINKENIRALVLRKSKISFGWCLWLEDKKIWSTDDYNYAVGVNAPCVDKTLYWFKNIKTGEVYNLSRFEMKEKTGANLSGLGRLSRGHGRLLEGKWTIWNDSINDWANTLTKIETGLNSPYSDKKIYEFRNKFSDIVENCTRVELMKKYPSIKPSGLSRIVIDRNEKYLGWFVI